MSAKATVPHAAEPEGPWILVVGTPFCGFEFLGVFKTEADAEEEGVGNDDWWVHQLEVPAGGTVDASGTHIVVLGTPMSGIDVYGPYADADRALTAAERFEGDWHVVELQEV